MMPACSATARSPSTVWPSGLRRWLQAPVRKGVGSNPTAVISAAQLLHTVCHHHGQHNASWLAKRVFIPLARVVFYSGSVLSDIDPSRNSPFPLPGLHCLLLAEGRVWSNMWQCAWEVDSLEASVVSCVNDGCARAGL